MKQMQTPDVSDFELSIALREFVEHIPVPDIKADCFIEIAQFHFGRGLLALSVGNYKKCLSEMKECHYPLHEALR